MNRVRWPLLVALLVMLAAAPQAFGHAVLVSASPAQEGTVAASPPSVTLRFSEPVQLVQPTDLEVVDESGASVVEGPARVDEGNAKQISVGVRPALPDGTYTIRYRIVSADAHVIGGYSVFAVGAGPPGEPFFGGAAASGPSETGPWSVSARFIELVGLGGLLGLLAFRWLVWRPVWRRGPALAEEERGAALAWGRDVFWVVFGVLAVLAMLAEGYVLVVKTASALGTSVADVLTDPSQMSQLLAGTDFGVSVQVRGALLFVLFALGAWQFLSEFGSERAPKAPRPTGPLVPGLLMAGVAVAVLAVLSAQGHARQAPLANLSIAADTIHLVAVSVWIGGLAMLGATLWRVPRIAPRGGAGLAADTLAAFSKLALVAVSVALVTGVLRSVGELSDPAQLWETSYGVSVVIKLCLLAPVGFLALRHRKVVTSLRRVTAPSRATIAMVHRTATAELALTIAIVVVASVLVAQVPGRV